jgi:hypothetical protein
VSKAEEERERGNAAFRAQRYGDAERCYREGLQFIDKVVKREGEDTSVAVKEVTQRGC